jgi:S-DNA-T family DNA segregation ATPase FtsK/SpoIIIE
MLERSLSVDIYNKDNDTALAITAIRCAIDDTPDAGDKAKFQGDLATLERRGGGGGRARGRGAAADGGDGYGGDGGDGDDPFEEGLAAVPGAGGRAGRGGGGRGGDADGDGDRAGAGGDGRVPELTIRERPAKRELPRAPRPDYELPSTGLLDPPPEEPGGWASMTPEELRANAGMLETKLLEFGVEGRVLEVCGGPVITMYEYQLAPGVKISKVSNLSRELTMAMRAESIRVVAPIPGKNAIGLELPNAERGTVTLRELLESREYRAMGSPLTLALGVDITGVPVVTDLGRMPHLLIAGATGSGKSVGLDCLIMSILYKATPREVRFLMIDPKCVELALYHDLPHLIHPVLTDPEEATVALKWAVCEMDARYRLMAERGVRNIQGYNGSVAKEAEGPAGPGAGLDGEGPPEPLPYLVIIIDELSDLMVTAPKDVEVAIMRLSAKARASGIHLILATQRPTVDILTGVIKANLPTRISFQVAQKNDSRVILDQMGAETLLGKGDMLFQPPGTSRLRRLHGAYVSDDEKRRVTDHIREYGPPEYIETLAPPDADGAADSSELDEKYEEAVELVRRTGRATISHLQRHLRIGYNRSARIIEDMEREGVIGPQDGTRPRTIF